MPGSSGFSTSRSRWFSGSCVEPRNALSSAISDSVHGLILMSTVGSVSSEGEKNTATWRLKSVRPMFFQASAAVVIIRG